MPELLKSILIAADVFIILILFAVFTDGITSTGLLIIVLISLAAGLVRHRWGSRRKEIADA